MALPLLTSTELRRLVETHLRAALPVACAALAVRTRIALPPPSWWQQAATDDPEPSERTPGAYVTAGDLTMVDQDFDVWWADGDVTVTCVASGRNRVETQDRAAAYAAAARHALHADVTLAGAAADMWWRSETPDAPTAARRGGREYWAAAATQVTYRVAVPRRLPPTLLPPGTPGLPRPARVTLTVDRLN